uniref:Uncharacterized protein n=1 Tax=Rhizophora mucronata TaxID=61149 RepID=A0A2P2NVM1_RHIMU
MLIRKYGAVYQTTLHTVTLETSFSVFHLTNLG